MLRKLMLWLTGNHFSIGGNLNVSSSGIITERDKYFTQEGLCKMHIISRLLPEFAGDFTSSFISDINRINPNIRIKIFYDTEQVRISVNTPQFVNRLNRAISEYLSIKHEFEKLPEEIQTAGIHKNNGVRRWSFTRKDVDALKSKYDSFTDVSNHIREDGGVYFVSSIVITSVYKDNDALITYLPQVEGLLGKYSTKFQTIDGNIGTFLSSFSPTTSKGRTTCPQVLLSEENLTHALPFRKEGIVCDKGLSIGVNVSSNTPFWADIFGNPEGCSTLVCAKPGAGKSTLCYTYTMSFAALGNMTVYVDIKGTEVSECLGNVMSNLITINFSGKDSRVFNTLRLSRSIPNYTMAMAINYTAESLSVLCAIREVDADPNEVLSLLRHAIKSYYNAVGVREDQYNTYEATKTMSYAGLLDYFDKQITGDDEGRNKLVKSIVERLTEAIKLYRLDGVSLNIEELVSKSVVIFSFNKNTDTTVTVLDSYRIYLVLIITKQLAKYVKQQKRFINVMVEEAARILELPALGRGVSDLASGSRSDNLSVTVITNSISIFKQPELQVLKSNIANFFMGNSDNEVVDILSEVFYKKRLAKDLKAVLDNPRKYNRVFATYYSLGTQEIHALVRCDIPKSVSAKFSTRTVEGEVS